MIRGSVKPAPDVYQRGFGVIEIVISMFLLAILAIGFLPLLITSLSSGMTNVTIATATQLVEQELGLARVESPTCTALTAFGDSVPVATTDARGATYQPSRTVAPCSSALTAYPTTVRVNVSVAVTGSGVAPVSATTLIYLEQP